MSTEITGYALSALVYLHERSGARPYLEAACRAARFLTQQAWDPAARVMPFELAPAAHAYFFDCGIIVRGLLAYWRAVGDRAALDVAVATGEFMRRDFPAPRDGCHPVLALPSRAPLERDPSRWSRSAGCYQLKSAMAWWDLAEATGDESFRGPYQRVLEESLATYREFLPGHPDRLKVMDRLHAFCYFLEGLLPRADSDPRCAAALSEGIAMAAFHLRDLAGEFARSDVFAQLLRARLYAAASGAVPLDHAAAEWEAAQLAGFQREDGGYWFGRKGGEWLPYSNPVSTAFAAQALECRHGELAPRQLLI